MLGSFGWTKNNDGDWDTTIWLWKWPFCQAKQYIHALRSHFGHRPLVVLLPANWNCILLFFLVSVSALFLVDAVNEMYLWHGWWPQSDEDSDSRASTTGSAETRWSNDRRLAMETTKSYAEGSYSHLSVHNHVQVDVMGKQFPFLKISLCVINKSVCSV